MFRYSVLKRCGISFGPSIPFRVLQFGESNENYGVGIAIRTSTDAPH
jgi:hypothetical protein